MCARVSTSCFAPRLGLATLVGVISLATATVYGQEEAVKAKTEKKTSVDPSGTWKWEREFRETVLRSTLVLKKEADGKLTGTLQTIFGDGGGPGSDPVKIDNGKIDGDKVTFSVTRSFNDNEFTIDYVGKYANGKLGGTYTLDFGNGPREFAWDAKRFVSADALVGKWNLKFEGPNGQPIESSMTIKKDDKDKLAGTYHSRFFGDAPMTKLVLKDGDLSFVVVFKTGNGEFPIAYSGKPVGDMMKGTLTTEFGGQKNETPFAAKLEEKPVEKKADSAEQVEAAKENPATQRR